MQAFFDTSKEGPLLGMQQAVSPHLLEATRQHVLEEAVDKLLSAYGGDFRGAGLGVTIAERDIALVKSEDISVADRDTKDIRGQVLDGCLATANGDDVHNPVLLPEVRGDLIEEAGFFQQIAEFATKDPSQWLFRQEVVVSCCAPGAVRCQPTAGYQVVHVGVISQIASPGLQNADHAEGASDVFRIGGQLLQGLLRSLKEQVINDLLAPAGKASQTTRQSEGGHEVGDRQEKVSLLIDPTIDLFVLTLRAMAILTGVIPVMLLPTLGASVDMPA